MVAGTQRSTGQAEKGVKMPNGKAWTAVKRPKIVAFGDSAQRSLQALEIVLISGAYVKPGQPKIGVKIPPW